MPYANEHSGRLKDPAQYRTCRRTSRKHEGKTYLVITCQRKDNNKWEEQAYRYPKADWTAAAARAHAKAHKAILFEPASGTKEASEFSCALLQSPVRKLSALGPVEERDGLPVQRFTKDLIFVNRTYRHPIEGWRLAVDQNRAQNWVKQFNEMKSRGVRVPVVKDHIEDTDHTLGYLENMILSDGTVLGTIEARGKDAIETLQRVDQVSVGIKKDYSDGDGHQYGEVIRHVGMTPIPVVSGQSAMTRIAASMDSETYPVFVLANEGASEMEWQKLREVLGVEQDVTEENALDVIETAVIDLRGKAEKSTEEVTKLNASMAELKEQIKPNENEPDADMIEDHAETVQERLSAVGEKLGLKPAALARLSMALIGSPEARNTRFLSRQAEPDENGRRPIRALALVEALEEIDPKSLIKTGGKTGVQTFSLSSGQDKDPETERKEREQDVEASAKRMYGAVPA